jgi:hypothetical protein
MSSRRSQHPQHPHPQHTTEVPMKNQNFIQSLTSTRAARMARLTYITVVLLQVVLAILLLRSAPETFEHPAGVCSPTENPVPGDVRRPIVGVPPPLPRAHGEEVTAWA